MLSALQGSVPEDLSLALAREPDPVALSRTLERVAAVVLAARVSVTVAPDDAADGPAGAVLDPADPCTLRLPLHWGDATLGWLVAERAESSFDADQVALAGRLADHGALALDHVLTRIGTSAALEELARFRALATASRDLIALADDDGRPQFVNSRVAEVGLEIGERGLWGVIAGDDGADALQEMRRAVFSEGRWSGDIRPVGPDEPTVVHGTVFRLLHPTTGLGIGTGWVAEDVTAVRETERALRSAHASLERFQALVEASSDFIAIAALDGSVMYLNPAGRELIGLPADIDVTTTTIVDYLTPEGIEASLAVEQPAVQADGHWEGESTLRNYRSGPAIPVAIASFLMLHPETKEPFALATVQRDISERKANEDALRRLADQRQDLLNRLVRAQAEERAEVANDVHDDPVQALAAVDLRLGLLARKLGDQAPQLLADLAPVQDSVTGASKRLRALVFNLQPPDFDEGLAGALEVAARDIFATSSTRCTVVGSDEPSAPDATRAVGFRVAREAMTNVRKHAGAASLVVTVGERDGGLEVSVVDDGVGLAGAPALSSSGHHGLGSMRDRAEIAGGRWNMTERPEGGVEVVCWLPLVSANGLSPGPAPR